MASDTDDDFDDFNEPVVAINEDDDDGFGDFDVGSTGYIQLDNSIAQQQIDDLLNEILPTTTIPETTLMAIDELLDERSNAIFSQLSRLPHLRPNYWMKLHIRHNLLIKLGIPINLDELHEQTKDTHNRKKSVNEQDIDWQGFVIPEFGELNISQDQLMQLMNKTNEMLSKFELDNLNNSSSAFLEGSDEEKLREKLNQLKDNYKQLLQLSSVWTHQFDELKKNSEIYELVVQNLIGYSQKLERDELLNNLKQVKSKAKKRRSIWK